MRAAYGKHGVTIKSRKQTWDDAMFARRQMPVAEQRALPPLREPGSSRPPDAALGVRKCPHGVDVGPLDDYGVPESERVFSTYCGECYREQTGVYPPEHERGQYTWPGSAERRA